MNLIPLLFIKFDNKINKLLFYSIGKDIIKEYKKIYKEIYSFSIHIINVSRKIFCMLFSSL